MALNLNVGMAILFEDTEVVQKIGDIRLNKIWVNNDGAGTVQLHTDTSFVDMGVFNQMASHGDEDIEAYFKFELEE